MLNRQCGRRGCERRADSVDQSAETAEAGAPSPWLRRTPRDDGPPAALRPAWPASPRCAARARTPLLGCVSPLAPQSVFARARVLWPPGITRGILGSYCVNSASSATHTSDLRRLPIREAWRAQFEFPWGRGLSRHTLNVESVVRIHLGTVLPCRRVPRPARALTAPWAGPRPHPDSPHPAPDAATPPGRLAPVCSAR